ncbi:unnamed protein product [Trichobilharzia regenti]|nr:unnamed protein product [Trichobilharzia regenti]
MSFCVPSLYLNTQKIAIGKVKYHVESLSIAAVVVAVAVLESHVLLTRFLLNRDGSLTQGATMPTGNSTTSQYTSNSRLNTPATMTTTPTPIVNTRKFYCFLPF